MRNSEEFTIYWKDTPMTKVTLNRTTLECTVKKIKDDCFEQWFKMQDPGFNDVYLFVKSRVFDQDRVDGKQLLEELGLTEYNPYEIMRITHGANFDDYWWVKYKEDPEHLAWKDVKLRD